MTMQELIEAGDQAAKAGKYSYAIVNYQNAILLNMRLGNRDIMASLFEKIGCAYTEIGTFDSAIDSFCGSLTYLPNQESKSRIYNALHEATSAWIEQQANSE